MEVLKKGKKRPQLVVELLLSESVIGGELIDIKTQMGGYRGDNFRVKI